MKKSDEDKGNGKMKKKAEQLLKTRNKKSDYSLTESDALKLIHALEVHQIELELQNEELSLAKNELTSVSNKYTDLYDFAPNGYFTLSKEGKILELNFNGAELLGKEKSELANSQFGFFVEKNSIGDFTQFLQKVFTSLAKVNIEIVLLLNKNKNRTIYLTGIANENRDECFVTTVDITEKKLAEESLKLSEKRFEDLVKLLPEAVFEIDKNLTLTYANQQAMDLFGYTQTDFTNGLNALEMLVPEEREKAKNIFAKRLKGEEPGTIEYRALKKDGTTFPILFHASSIVENGKLLGARGVIIDISERKQAEKELREFKDLFSLFMQHSPVYTFIKEVSETQSKVIQASDNYKYMVGLPGSEMIGKTMEELFSPEFAKSITADDLAAVKEGKVVQVDENFNNRNYTTIKFPLVMGNRKLLAGYTIDITDRKKAEEEIIEAKEKAEENEEKMRLAEANLKNTFQVSPSIIAKANLNTGFYVEANQAVTRILGYSVEEFISTPIKEMVLPDDFINTKNMISEQQKGKEVKSFENRYLCKDGTIKWISWNGSPADDKGIVIGVGSDITQQKLAEIELIKAKEKAEESDRLKSAFLANMSHEIRTPMNGILGFTNLLQNPDLTGEEQQEYIGIIQKSGDRMLNTVNDIINISKIEAGQTTILISEFSIDEQLKTIYSFFKPETDKKGIQFILKNSLTEQDAVIESDKEKLNSILTNLVKNAIKFCDKGKIEIGCSKREKELQFFVKDSGIGIPRNRQQAIFERFVQADIEDKNAMQGSGLGLAISKAYTEMLGGKIWVESEEGVGSTFYFTIPLNKNNKETPKKNSVNANEPLLEKKQLKILIVDDDEFAVTYLSIVLEKYAKEILVAETGIEAVEMCRKNPDINIVLMDIKISGIDGYEATKQIRDFNKNVFILAQTAYAQSGDREKAIEAGCNDYISKPVNKDVLLKSIEKHCAGKNV